MNHGGMNGWMGQWTKQPLFTPTAMERRPTFAANTVSKSFCPRPPVLSRYTSLEAAADNPTHCRHSETPGVAINSQLEKFSRPSGSRPHTPKLRD